MQNEPVSVRPQKKSPGGPPGDIGKPQRSDSSTPTLRRTSALVTEWPQ
jgi:hypothetical protein